MISSLQASAPVLAGGMLCCGLVGCLQPGATRAELDLEVGRAEAGGVTFEVHEGLAAVRDIEPGRLVLWAQAPTLRIDVAADADATTAWRVRFRNVLRDAQLVGYAEDGSLLTVSQIEGDDTEQTWEVSLPAGEAATLRWAAPDASAGGRWRFVLLSDVQEAIGEVQDVFDAIADHPEARFVVSTGDLSSSGVRHELIAFQEAMEGLSVPLYSTVGNHELGVEPGPWHALFGRASFQFRFRGVYFTFVDSGNSTVDPIVYGWLDDWLQRGLGSTNLLVTHVPPLDPEGTRNGSFRSRNEAAKLLARVAAGDVDAALYGHLHSFYALQNAGIPAYISGGGGAIEERLDGISRHFLVLDVGPEGLVEATLVRVD